LGELVDPAIASQLCISSGILDAQALQELGILNQVRPSKAGISYCPVGGTEDGG